jgi:hypothetical protein
MRRAIAATAIKLMEHAADLIAKSAELEKEVSKLKRGEKSETK